MKAFLWVISICIVFFVLVYGFKENIRQALLPNRIIVTTSGEINHTDVRIAWTCEGAQDTLSVYQSGKTTDAPFEGRGLNVFLVYNKDQYLGQIEQFKTSSTNSHVYHFTINQKGDSVQLDCRIHGPDATL